MILDNSATGVARVLRELGALALNPGGAVTRNGHGRDVEDRTQS